MYGILIISIIVINWVIFKRLIFKIICSFLLIVFGLIGYSLSKRYSKTLKSVYITEKTTYSELLNNTSLKIIDETKYPLSKIKEYDVPKRIKILSKLQNNCNVNDTIVQLDAVGPITRNRIWLIKKSEEVEIREILRN